MHGVEGVCEKWGEVTLMIANILSQPNLPKETERINKTSHDVQFITEIVLGQRIKVTIFYILYSKIFISIVFYFSCFLFYIFNI